MRDNIVGCLMGMALGIGVIAFVMLCGMAIEVLSR